MVDGLTKDNSFDLMTFRGYINLRNGGRWW